MYYDFGGNDKIMGSEIYTQNDVYHIIRIIFVKCLVVDVFLISEIYFAIATLHAVSCKKKRMYMR